MLWINKPLYLRSIFIFIFNLSPMRGQFFFERRNAPEKFWMLAPKFNTYSKGWQKNQFEEQQTEFIETYTFMFRKVKELVLDQKSY